MTNADITLAAGEPHVWAAADPYWVGAIVLIIMLGMVGALIAFGNGRDHS